MCRRKNLSPEDVLDIHALTTSDLKVLAQDPLVEIGGHTDTHRPLSELTVSDARHDIARNRAYLEGLIQTEVRHFAYPFGDARACAEREFALCAEMGFRSATTARIGNLFLEHKDQKTALPRLRFNGDCESIGFLECQRTGATNAIATRFGKPVATI
jgi:peptidoglycan/xylan/chitin deacetylase (PgdA/CDA1 family)